MDLVLNSAFDDISAFQVCYTDSPIRFTEKSINANERTLFDMWWSEILSVYGQQVDYFESMYSLSSHDAFYGEDPSAGFDDPKSIIIGVSISNDSVLLSKFGIQATSDFTGLIHINKFKEIFGENAEPKSDDVIRLTEFGNDRPGGRTGPMYQITNRDDEDLSQINQLAGHYVWLVRGKRYDHTNEPNIPKETVIDQVYENAFSGNVLSADDVKKYNYDVDKDAKTNIFDYGKNKVDTSVYGDY